MTVELVEEIQAKTKEYLQPNPTARAKMIAVKGISKLSGQAKSNTYPQAEGVLADCMLIYGKRLGEDTSIFGEFKWIILQNVLIVVKLSEQRTITDEIPQIPVIVLSSFFLIVYFSFYLSLSHI